MRYSIRSICLYLLFASLILALLVSTRRVQELQERLRSLRDSHGMYTQDLDGTGADRWEWVALARRKFEFDDTVLLRVFNYQRYRIRVHFFDPATNKYEADFYKFASLDTVIRLMPSESAVFIHETTRPIESSLVFEIPTTDRTHLVHFGHYSGAICNEPIFGFLIVADSCNQSRKALVFHDYSSREEIENTCRQHKQKFVWFTIEPEQE